MEQYLDLMRYVQEQGDVKTDRTGTGTKSKFGYQMRFDLSKGLPLVTTKKIHLKSIIHELIWFLAGGTNVKYLQNNGVKIWDDWADSNGDLGPVYGGQWRAWEDTKILSMDFEKEQIQDLIIQGYRTRTIFEEVVRRDGSSGKYTMAVMQKKIDQISDAMALIKNNPDSRRIIVSAWNVGDIAQMKLPPCHSLFQFYVNDLTLDERFVMLEKKLGLRAPRVDRDLTPPSLIETMDIMDRAMLDKVGIPRQKLSCQLYQRSADIFLGVPFNIASYAILTHMFAQQAGMAVGDFVWTGGDCHLYSNHMEQVQTQLARTPHALPQLVIKRKPDSLFDYKFEDFEIVGYEPDPAIKAPVAV